MASSSVGIPRSPLSFSHQHVDTGPPPPTRHKEHRRFSAAGSRLRALSVVLGYFAPVLALNAAMGMMRVMRPFACRLARSPGRAPWLTARVIIYTSATADRAVDTYRPLERYGVTRLVDVRTQPYSPWCPVHARTSPGAAGGRHRYLTWRDLGGRPADPPSMRGRAGATGLCYSLAATPLFQEALGGLGSHGGERASPSVILQRGRHRHCHAPS